MVDPFITEHKLVPRGGAGLCCDEEGVALGPVPLVVRSGTAGGRREYVARPPAEIVDALQVAFGPIADEAAHHTARVLGGIAKALTDGETARAAIAAVQIGLRNEPP